jgi:hypothetical protein
VALGYCAVCEKLVTIQAKGYKWAGSRERHWYPISHLNPQLGKNCTGEKKAL